VGLRRRAEAQLAGLGLARPIFGRALVHPGHFAAAGIARQGLNINGPCLIRVPEWAPCRAHPDARYYLYFAHHLGQYLRMAWAPRLQGPWTLHNCGSHRDARWLGAGVYDLVALPEQGRAMQEGLRIGSDVPRRPLHIASPDVHLDVEARQFVMYAHMPVIGGEEDQMSFALRSEDGLWFEPVRRQDGAWVGLAPAYLRVFEYQGRRYGVTPGGWLHRAPQRGWGETEAWTRGPQLFDVPSDAPLRPDGRPRLNTVARHLAVCVEPSQDRLTLYFSRVADAPERIIASDVALGADWRAWTARATREVHRAYQPWEGAGHLAKKSAGGVASGGVNQLRDPFVFVDEHGRRTLLYTVQGERAVAARTLT